MLVSETRSGNDWRQVDGVPTRSTLTAVTTVGNDAWAVGHDGIILHSGDGGLTWQRQRLSLRTEPHSAISGMDAITASLEVRDVAATPPRAGEDQSFLQLQGLYSIEARVAGDTLRFAAPGFAEVFVPAGTPE